MPELVYLQTRKLLRDEHFKRRETRQQHLDEHSGSDSEDNPKNFFKKIDEEAEDAEDDSESKVRVS